MTDELKACPFCGSIKLEIDSINYPFTFYFVKCDCGARGKSEQGNEIGVHEKVSGHERAIKAWNKRA